MSFVSERSSASLRRCCAASLGATLAACASGSAVAPQLDLGVVSQTPAELAPSPLRDGLVPPEANAAALDCTSQVLAGHIYTLCRAPLDWDQARQRCVELGGDLASIGTIFENDALAMLVSAAGVGRASVGLTDAASEAGFVNVDGSPCYYTAWLPGEPNDAGGEDCLELDADGNWNDVPCRGAARAFICEQAGPCTVEVVNEHRYSFCRRSGDWTAARDYCLRLGADLATPDSPEENAILASRMGVSLDIAHIGISDAQVEGQFTGVDGGALTYSNWYPGEPNDDGQREDCASILSNGQWNDIPCSGSPLGAFVCEDPQPCLTRWYGGHRYLFCLDQANAVQARERCLQEHGDLATVESAEEDAFLYRTISLFHRGRFYIGLNDEQQEGAFVWRTGAPLGYSHWNAGEPNNQGEEDCVEILEGGVWNDISCTEHARNGYVCELR